MDVKFQGILWLWFFPGVSISRYIFPRGRFSVTFFGVGDWSFFSDITFFWGIRSTKIQFQGIYESYNHSLQDALVFKNLVIHTPVPIKNGIAHSKAKNPDPLKHNFFLIIPGNSTSFLINPWKFHLLFLWYPSLKVSCHLHPDQPVVLCLFFCFFFGITRNIELVKAIGSNLECIEWFEWIYQKWYKS